MESEMQNTREFDCDLVIIGAGLTGLSLACWLVDLARKSQQAMPSVCLIEPRTEYQNDRTWCFWDLEQHPFRELIKHRWSRWQVSAGERIVTQSDGHTAYAMLPAADVYNQALTCIESCPELSLQKGTRVHSIEEQGDGVLVSTDSTQWWSRSVVDTRPPKDSQLTGNTGFWQGFTGYELYCPSHGFQKNIARLMDFQSCQEHLCFIYLLPLDSDRLLVEWTEFNPCKAMRECQGQLESWLANQGINGYQVVRSESALLPMIPVRRGRQRGRVVKAGVGAGWMRAASGYHFASCQRGSENLARQILAASAGDQWQLRPPDIRSRWLDGMDRIFLRALRRHPEKAQQWFLDLFAATTAGQMARFMNDQPRWRDGLAIIRALPPRPFLGAAML